MAYDRPYETKAGTGTLFPNDRKTQDNHPDYKGKIKWHNGTEAWLSAWEKESKTTGVKFLSIQVGDYITPQTTPHEQAKVKAYQPQKLDDDNEVPF
jgi:uncharacterized protein (DUF736 family)